MNIVHGILCINILISASGSACSSSLHCPTYNLQLLLLSIMAAIGESQEEVRNHLTINC